MPETRKVGLCLLKAWSACLDNLSSTENTKASRKIVLAGFSQQKEMTPMKSKPGDPPHRTPLNIMGETFASGHWHCDKCEPHGHRSCWQESAAIQPGRASETARDGLKQRVLNPPLS